MLSPSNQASDAIRRHVAADLDPSLLKVHLKLFCATLTGGLLSLMICAQYGFALTPMARNFGNLMHATMDPVICAMICGFAFALFPIAVLRLFLTSPMGFRAIYRRFKSSILYWHFLSGVLLSAFGHHGTEIFFVIIWLTSATITTLALTQIMFILIPAWSLPHRFKAAS